MNDHYVEIRTNKKGPHLLVAYEDLRTVPQSALEQELMEGGNADQLPTGAGGRDTLPTEIMRSAATVRPEPCLRLHVQMNNSKRQRRVFSFETRYERKFINYLRMLSHTR